MKNPVKRMVFTAMLVIVRYSAYACTCPPPPPATEAARQSDLVFLGKVESVRTHRSSDFVLWVKDLVADLGEALGRDWHSDPSRDFRRYATFQIIERFKGASTKEVVIRTGWGGGDCGAPFDAGGTYLVFARHLEERDEFVTGSCSGTGEARRKHEQLAQLRAGI